MMWRVITGDCRDVLPSLDAESVQTCVTSPPYWGQRDYGHDAQIGQESDVGAYVDALREVFAEVRRVLRPDGTAWLNLGDKLDRRGSYHGIPWRVALALKDDGWLVRQEVIWAKRNGLPEGSARDRPHRFHEQVFLLAPNRRYYYDEAAIREDSDPAQEAHNRRYAKEYDANTERARHREPGNVNHVGIHSRPGPGGRSKRSVWRTSVARHYRDIHTATYPVDLVEPCVLAGAPVGGVVLDPFSGAATTGVAALRHGREYIGVELNPAYAERSRERLAEQDGQLVLSGSATHKQGSGNGA